MILLQDMDRVTAKQRAAHLTRMEKAIARIDNAKP
jgi:hypothetical protein